LQADVQVNPNPEEVAAVKHVDLQVCVAVLDLSLVVVCAAC
jgi:hypothetical protein